MREGAYEFLAAREEIYWWHRARRQMARGLLRRYGVPSRLRWLDLGCGPGGNLALLNELDPELVVGIDLSSAALRLANAKAAHARLVNADIAETLPFADRTFDLVTSFNVLYHDWIKDEAPVLAEIWRVLKPGGLMLATEPAFPVLTRALDLAVMTRRRYRGPEFAAMCEAAGLQVLFRSYFTSFGFPLILSIKALNRFRKLWRGKRDVEDVSIDMQPLPAVANEFMFAIARAEAAAIIWGAHMPFGTTLVCLARKV